MSGRGMPTMGNNPNTMPILIIVEIIMGEIIPSAKS
jgi:hypothetical protein